MRSTHSGARQKKTYLLTFAAGAFGDFITHTELDKVQGSVDFVNLMTYDFRVAEADPISGHHANLFPHPADVEQRSVDRAVKAFLAAGVPPSKLVVGVPFYGRGWAEVAPDRNGRYQPGKPIQPRMDLNYSNLAAQIVGRDGFERFWDADAQAPYLWNAGRHIFITYEDPESLGRKGRYIQEHGLAGAMFCGVLLGHVGRAARMHSTGRFAEGHHTQCEVLSAKCQVEFKKLQ